MKDVFAKGNYIPSRKDAKIFYPHSFKPQIELLAEIPLITIGVQAYEKMWHYADIAEQEVSWLGSAEEIESNSHQSDYFIKDVFLLRQQVSSASTEITQQGLVDLAEELLSLPNGNKLYEEIRFWGHSHVNMDTNPSLQDEAQMEVFRQSGHPFFIRGILNKHGKICFTVYRYDCGIKITDVSWELYESFDADLRARIEKEFAEKVSQTQQIIFSRKEESDNGIIKTAFRLLAGKAQEQEN